MKRALFFLVCWLSGQALSAQTTQQVRRAASESYMKEQVLHFDDFIKRFNGGVSETRREALQQLFDQDDPRRDARHVAHTAYAHLIREFTNEILQENVLIPAAFRAEAIVRLAARSEGQPDTLVLRLNKEYTRDHASYWHVTGVTKPASLSGNAKTSCQTAHPTDLPPNAHEVSFLPLLRGILDYRSLCPFTRCTECVDDDWQQTEHALQTGGLEVGTVSAAVLRLNAGTRWRLEVREFIREQGNSGWLISDIIPL
nr:hypothetical protein [uncultured Dyadobacter sp.]